MDKELLFNKYFNSSLKFLSYRPRSEKEVRDYLKIKSQKSKVKSEQEINNLIESIITRLKEHKFLDDVEFARWFTEQRTSLKPKAARLIKMELKQKGIAGEIIDNLPLTIDDLENAKKLLDKKFDRYKNLDKDEIYKKLGGFLTRRGFDWDTIKKAIDESFSKVV